MTNSADTRLSVWHRLTIGSIAGLIIALSIATGLLTREGAVAQDKKPVEGIAGGVPGGVAGGVTGGIPGGVKGDVGFAITDGQDNLIERLDKAAEVAMEFKNSTKAPLTITDARAKSVLRRENTPGDEYAVIPIVTVTNSGDRRIKFLTLEFRNGLERRAYSERLSTPIEPHTTFRTGGQRRFLILTGGAQAWSVRVAGVLFEDGDVWGTVPPPPPPPPPPAEMLQLEQAPETSIQFENSEGAPVSITAAAAKAVPLDRQTRESLNPAARWAYLVRPILQVVNNTDKRIVSVAIACATPESTSIAHTSITLEPHASGKLERENGGFVVVHGNFERMKARVIGVKFEDGEIWGRIVLPPSPPVFTQPPPPPPPPQETSASESPKLIRKSGGVLMGLAIRRVSPEYPAEAKAAQISGAVVVEVTVDESGNVISARAISGHPLLKDAAVVAARQWQFAPTMLAGEPVKVVGTLTFNFQL